MATDTRNILIDSETQWRLCILRIPSVDRIIWTEHWINPMALGQLFYRAQLIFRGHEMGCSVTHGHLLSPAALEYSLIKRMDFELAKRPFELFIVNQLDLSGLE